MDKINIKDKAVLAYVEELEAKLNVYEESPYLNTYITIKGQIDSFNEQLTIKNLTSKTIFEDEDDEIGKEVDFIPGKIDLFGDKDEKCFDRAWKYMLESIDMLKKLDELRKLMTPDLQEELSKKIKHQKLGVAEKLALNSIKK